MIFRHRSTSVATGLLSMDMLPLSIIVVVARSVFYITGDVTLALQMADIGTLPSSATREHTRGNFSHRVQNSVRFVPKGSIRCKASNSS